MPPIYQTQPVAVREESAVVVVHCSDPRYQPHFQDFLRNALKLERYALVAVPGGAQFLTMVDYLPKFSWVGWRWMKFMFDVARAERLVLIAHDDCLWYFNRHFGLERAALRPRQEQDMREVRAALAERFPRLRVESYYARISGEQATIEAIA